MKALIATAIGAVLIAMFAVGGLLSGLGGNRDHGPRVKSTIRQQRTEPEPVEGAVLPTGEPLVPAVDVAPPPPAMEPNILMPAPGTDSTANPGQVYAPSPPPPAPVATPTLPDPRQVTTTSIPRETTPPPPMPRETTPPHHVTPPRQVTPRERADPPLSEIVVEENRHAGGIHHESRRTSPVPTYQPVPSVEKLLREDGTLRVRLTIGADGRVREVDVLQPLAGATARLIGAIQQWRFRPATEDGRAVEGTFDTELSFNAQR